MLDGATRQNLTAFQTLLAMYRPDPAVPIGRAILGRYPPSRAAAQVAKRLPGIEVRPDAGKMHLAKAHVVSTDVTVAGKAHATLVSGAGGFDPVEWKPLPKK